MSIFTRQHYVWLASHMRDQRHHLDNATFVTMILDLADELQAENPQFNRRKFIDACYVNAGE